MQRKFDFFMKNKLILVLCAIAACCFVACDSGTSPECKYHSDTFDIPKKGDKLKWDFDKTNREFVCRVNMPDITSYIYNFGNWSLCREFNKGKSDAYQIALPMSQFKCDTVEAESTIYYTQYLDYRVGTEYVDIQLTNSDFFYAKDASGNPIPPETMDFRLQVGTNSIPLVVNQSDWKFDSNNLQFYASFDAPEIPVEVFEGGQWSIHRVYNMGTKDAFQVALPMSCYAAETLVSKTPMNYTEHLDYRVGIGYVEIRLRTSDHVYVENILGQPIPPEEMNFRLQLIY